MCQPPGFAAPGQEHLVCKLEKGIYGLQQSGHGWYVTMYTGFTKMGFMCCAVDHVVFFKHQNGKSVIVTVHVDDMTCRKHTQSC